MLLSLMRHSSGLRPGARLISISQASQSRLLPTHKDEFEVPKLTMPRRDYVSHIDLVNDIFLRLRNKQDECYAWEIVAERRTRDERL
ncbi:MAG: hypothetical protein Q8P67_12700, partial [archaeon]|nr:hypothetical protein [archaeon]